MMVQLSPSKGRRAPFAFVTRHETTHDDTKRQGRGRGTLQSRMALAVRPPAEAENAAAEERRLLLPLVEMDLPADQAIRLVRPLLTVSSDPES